MNTDPSQSPNTPVQSEPQPVPISQEVPATQAGTPAVATPVAPSFQSVQPVAGEGSKALAIWSLALSIMALLTLLLFFISGPLAITALVLGIIALAKRKPGKGLSIAGVVISGITLVLLPFALAIALVAYGGVSEKARQNLESGQQREQ